MKNTSTGISFDLVYRGIRKWNMFKYYHQTNSFLKETQKIDVEYYYFITDEKRVRGKVTKFNISSFLHINLLIQIKKMTDAICHS